MAVKQPAEGSDEQPIIPQPLSVDEKDIIDLNAVDPKPVMIRIGDPPRDIKVNPPSTVVMFRLQSVGKQLEKAADASDEEIEAIVVKMTDLLKRCVPELGEENLTIMKLIALSKIIVDMGVPGDIEELKKRGLEPTDPKVPKPE